MKQVIAIAIVCLSLIILGGIFWRPLAKKRRELENPEICKRFQDKGFILTWYMEANEV